MTTSQPGIGKCCDACHSCKAHSLNFIRPPLVSTVSLQWDQDQLPQLICMLLLLCICCWIAVFAVAGFSPEKVAVGNSLMYPRALLGRD